MNFQQMLHVSRWALHVALLVLLSLAFPFFQYAKAQNAESNKASLLIYSDRPQGIINRNIYGQFAEHLGRLIYGGLWVGEDSTIPNTRGLRDDVVGALKKLQIPVLRWPGGCFADEYHWTALALANSARGGPMRAGAASTQMPSVRTNSWISVRCWGLRPISTETLGADRRRR